jgi:hypothetical protein
MSYLDDLIDKVNGNVAAELEQTQKFYPVPSRKFTLTGKTLADVLAAEEAKQDAHKIVCREGETQVWIGETSDRSSNLGSYFNVTVKKLNQHSNEYTFKPGV